MKNLANCKPSEFLKQTNLIKKSVDRWLTDTDILNIRKRVATLEIIDKSASKEERNRIFAENKAKTDAQTRQNISDILDAVLDEHPDETLEVLALVCFVDPANVDDYPVSDYLEAISEMLSNEAVIGFFTSLARWGRTNTSAAPKA